MAKKKIGKYKKYAWLVVLVLVPTFLIFVLSMSIIAGILWGVSSALIISMFFAKKHRGLKVIFALGIILLGNYVFAPGQLFTVNTGMGIWDTIGWTNPTPDNSVDNTLVTVNKPLNIYVADAWSYAKYDIDTIYIYDQAAEVLMESITGGIGSDGKATTTDAYESDTIIWVALVESGQITHYFEVKVPRVPIADSENSQIEINAEQHTLRNNHLNRNGKFFSFYEIPTVSLAAFDKSDSDLTDADPDLNITTITTDEKVVWFSLTSSVLDNGLPPKYYDPIENEYYEPVLMFKLPAAGTEEELLDIVAPGFTKLTSSGNDVYFYQTLDALYTTYSDNAQGEVVNDGYFQWTITLKNLDDMSASCDFDIQLDIYRSFDVSHFTGSGGNINSEATSLNSITMNVDA